MFDVVVIGGATRDFFMISSRYRVADGRLELPWGEKTVVEELIKEVGGGGCNAAVAFSRLGLKVALMTRVGEDSSGAEVIERLQKEDVARDLVQIRSDSTTSLSCLLTDPSGEHTIVMYRGDNDHYLEEEIDWQALKETKWLYVADVTAVDNDPTDKLAEFAKSNQLKVAFVPGQHQLVKGIKGMNGVLPKTEILILNAYEADLLTGSQLDLQALGESLQQLDGMLKIFTARGVKLVVITADKHGARCSDGQNFYYTPPPRIEKIVNTTGAGDAFAAAFTAAIIRGKGVAEALSLATQNAGSVLQKVGAQAGLMKTEIV